MQMSIFSVVNFRSILIYLPLIQRNLSTNYHNEIFMKINAAQYKTRISGSKHFLMKIAARNGVWYIYITMKFTGVMTSSWFAVHLVKLLHAKMFRLIQA